MLEAMNQSKLVKGRPLTLTSQAPKRKKINKVILKFKRKLSNLKTYFLNENQVMEPSGGPASQLEATLVRPENVC